MHCWLQQDREESYSDWLSWILEQIEEPSHIVALLGSSMPDHLVRSLGTKKHIERECFAGRPDEGDCGRLDIVVRYTGVALFLLELKLTAAEEAETEKQGRIYTPWLHSQPEAFGDAILLSISSEEAVVHEFRVRTWRDFCLELRRLIPALVKRKGLPVALALAFAGAVEQNLLDFPAQPLRQCAPAGCSM